MSGLEKTKESFTVASSAEDLRYAARAGEVTEAKSIIARYKDAAEPLSKLLPAVLSATDDLSGNSALHLSCANGHLEIVRLLIVHGAPLDTKNLSGSTPLHYAALTGQLDVVQELIKSGAEAVVENGFGKTALDEAHNGRHRDVAKFLIDHVEATGKAPDLDEAKSDEGKEGAANGHGNP